MAPHSAIDIGSLGIIPKEVFLCHILSRLNARELCRCSLVSRAWKALSEGDELWAHLYVRVRRWQNPLWWCGQRLVLACWKDLYRRRVSLQSFLDSEKFAVEPPFLCRKEALGLVRRRYGNIVRLAQDNIDMVLPSVKEGDTVVVVGQVRLDGCIQLPKNIEIIGDYSFRSMLQCHALEVSTGCRLSSLRIVGFSEGDRGVRVISNYSTDVLIEDCNIEGGLRIQDSERVEVRFCRIIGSDSDGVRAEGRSSVRLVCTSIGRCAGDGLRVTDCSRVVAYSCDVYGAAHVGISCGTSEGMWVSTSRIHGNGSTGVAVNSQNSVETGDGHRTTLLLEESDVSTNHGHGLHATGQTIDVKVISSSIKENDEQGALIEGGCNVDLSNNNFACNKGGGVICSGEASLTAVENCICGNGSVGVVLDEEAKGHLERNEVLQHQLAGVSVGGVSSSEVFANRVYENGAGVIASRSSTGHMTYNSFYRNQASGIVLRGQSEFSVARNVCFGNRADGIDMLDSTRGIVEENRLCQNGRTGVSLGGDVRCLVRSNVMQENCLFGAHIWGDSSPILEGNCITENLVGGVLVEDHSRPTVKGNEAKWNCGPGITIRGWAGGSFAMNSLVENTSNGLEMSGNARPLVCGNQSESNGGTGVLASGDGDPVVSGNCCESNAHGDIKVSSTSHATLHENMESSRTCCKQIVYDI